MIKGYMTLINIFLFLFPIELASEGMMIFDMIEKYLMFRFQEDPIRLNNILHSFIEIFAGIKRISPIHKEKHFVFYFLQLSLNLFDCSTPIY